MDEKDLKIEKELLEFFTKTVPCGFLKYTCEKQPRVTYINKSMLDILRISESADEEYLEMCKSNIYFFIPSEERRRFSKYLSHVYADGEPFAGEISLLRSDGTRAYVFGWVMKATDEQGTEEFQSICMDITEQRQTRKAKEMERYLRGLSDVYDKIFEFNLDAGTVKCLTSQEGSSFKKFENVAMQTPDALDKYLLPVVAEENREAVRSFFLDFTQKKPYLTESKPQQITYKAKSSDGSLKRYLGIFIKVDDSVSLYCCRETHDNAALRSENDKLRESMRDLVRHFSDGIAAFEVTPERAVKPLYTSENVWEFFGYTEDDWMALAEKYTPFEEFVRHSQAGVNDYLELLRRGEAVFTYFDVRTKMERKIKAVLSQKGMSSRTTRYVMLYPVDSSPVDERNIQIRTFGYFDVFVGGKPIAFANKKSKELLALLVDRRGGYITSEEAIGFLWEDEPANSVTFARYRKVALRLKNTLEEYGIPDIVESKDGKRRIVPEKIKCDLYDYLTGKEEYSGLFKGSYLSNYSWGEVTLGELVK